jgi:hypothetical protein
VTDTALIRFSVEGTAMDASFLELTLAERLLHERVVSWHTTATDVPPLGRVVASHHGERTSTQVIRRDDGALRIVLDSGWVLTTLACATPDGLDELEAIVRHQLPPSPPPEDDDREVAITFWANGAPRPRVMTRELEVPTWAEIGQNYAAETAAALEDLFALRPPLAGGRLVLWHGPPGTGKTNALRALAWEWRDRVTTHYVSDPEAFLGDPGYLQAVLLGPAYARDAWRLIVLEDAGELLAPDAKEQAGQGLARLLNLTDGLVGQGLKVVILITGNEPLDRLHPAVARPGRCAASIEFRRLDRQAATAWLGRHGHPAPSPAATLAELFARLEGREAPPERVFGFAR